MLIRNFTPAILVSVLLILSLASCSKSPLQESHPRTFVPNVSGDPVDPASLKAGESKIVTTSVGAQIQVTKRGSRLLAKFEGTFSENAFSLLSAQVAGLPTDEKRKILEEEVSQILKVLQSVQAVAIRQVSEVGYFTFEMPYEHTDILGAVKGLKVHRSVLINPIAHEGDALKNIHNLSNTAEGAAEGLSNTKNHSGLERIGALEFVKQAEAEIGAGAKVDGSEVRVGITDTGITLNHPAFHGADRKTRIAYMRDFTREGRVYFNPAAKLEIKESAKSEELILSAQVIVTPKLPEVPAADEFEEVKDLKIKVTSELREILLSGKGIQLGVLSEESFQSDEDPVDINGNGKKNDRLHVIFVPGKTSAQDVIYLDQSGTADFRKAKALGDWNLTRSAISIFAEKAGFDFRDDQLPSKDGKSQIPVKSVSIVGYDPGNHGSHVAGIIAARKTIANDEDDTLARGIAPNATILMNRVCANNGGCGATEALVDLALNAGAEVINMSLGGLNAFNDGFGVQETMVNRVSSLKNVLFVISAGNSGPGRQTVGSPSTARLSLSVGATATKAMIQRQYQWPGHGAGQRAGDDEDFVLFFSSRGPTAAGGFKPNVTAPGTELSAIQLNTAPGAHGGLFVYWGTSMAAPTAAGAYTLLLDGIKKYNAAHPDKPLNTDAITLRSVLVETARPFSVNRFDPTSGERTEGQYTWVDQGQGMINLPAAWRKLFQLRDDALPGAVEDDGKSVALDYQVIVSQTAPNGAPYDGSRQASPGNPAFGTGLYLSYTGEDTLRAVHIARRLPERLAQSEAAGDLTAQLRTTRDEFRLKTVIYGSDKVWLKAGVLDQLDCDGDVSPLHSIIADGATITIDEEGKASIAAAGSSTINVCLDRQAIAHELAPGDHGALISGYRVVRGKEEAIPSFVVPVYVTVPHHTLAQSTAYEVENTVPSFGVIRNYVTIPKGATVAKITLEVPALKTGESCSGVELMALQGSNVSKAFKTRKEARIYNCDPDTGAPLPEKDRKLTLAVPSPKAGIWDLPVFGFYKFKDSKYRLRVDYVVATPSVQQIETSAQALSGSLSFAVQEASLDVAPDSEKSTLELTGLSVKVESVVAKDKHVLVETPLGTLKSYPAGTKKVIIATGGSPGNDIDLAVIECSAAAASTDDASCETAGASGGSADVESGGVAPSPGM